MVSKLRMDSTPTTLTVSAAQQQLTIASRFEDDLLELLLVLHSLNKLSICSLFQNTIKGTLQWLYKFQEMLERNTDEARQRVQALVN